MRKRWFCLEMKNIVSKKYCRNSHSRKVKVIFNYILTILQKKDRKALEELNYLNSQSFIQVTSRNKLPS